MERGGYNPRLMKRLLAAFSFPLLILAGALLWHVYSVYSGRTDPVPSWQLILEMMVAFLFIIVGLAGVRMRHRLMTEEP